MRTIAATPPPVKYLVMGTKIYERALSYLPLLTPGMIFEHDTDEPDEGHVEHRDGHYAEALRRGKKVIPLLAEVLAPRTHAARFLPACGSSLSRVAAKHTHHANAAADAEGVGYHDGV